MSILASVTPQRRGACPGLSAPMPTGDGLLVRFMPIGTIPLTAFAALCAAARTHGNGVIEVTSRGSIQVRGLGVGSAPQFASDVAALGIAAADGVPVLTNALAGIDAEEIFDAAALATELRRTLAQRAMAGKLDAKISVAIDGGGALDLATLSADIRLSGQAINGGVVLRVGAGGDAASAADLGIVAPAHGVAVAMRLLEVLVRRGRNARARDVLTTDGAAVFRSAIADLLEGEAPSHPARRPREAIGLHRLRDGSLACGIGVAFGHADVGLLERFVEVASAAGASGVRAAPGRALMTIGLKQDTARAFTAAAERLGFLVRAGDPRRHVVACAGAPVCASAHIASRAVAPQIAAAAARLGGAFTIHVSGCAKGCAHPAPAALTIVGTPEGCALVADGSARDIPFAVVSAEDLSATIATALAPSPSDTRREGGHV